MSVVAMATTSHGVTKRARRQPFGAVPTHPRVSGDGGIVK